MAVQTLRITQVRWQIFAHSLAFVLGLSITFILLGYTLGSFGVFFARYDYIIRIVAGIFLIFMGIVMFRVLPIPFLQREFRLHMARKPSGYLGSVVVGVAFGAGWTPCIGPILGGILAIASLENAFTGGLLLAFYTLGFAVPFLLAAQALTSWHKLNKYSGIIEKIGGILLILVGVVLIANWITLFTPYLTSLGSLEGILGESVNPNFLIAFLAGVLSFLSPCVLPILPSFLAYLTGMNAEQLLQAG